MGLAELFDKVLYDQYLLKNTTVTPKMMALTMAFVVVLLIFMLIIYKITYTGAVFSSSFAISMVISALATSLIILPISSNIALSIGTGGVLSMVRFRTAVKDPRDIAYMFWAIAIGLVCGIGYYAIAAVATAGIGILLLIIHLLSNLGAKKESCIAVIRMKPNTNAAKVAEVLGKTVIRSIVTTQDYIEMTAELKNMPTADALAMLSKSDRIINTSFVKYNGDYAL